MLADITGKLLEFENSRRPQLVQNWVAADAVGYYENLQWQLDRNRDIVEAEKDTALSAAFAFFEGRCLEAKIYELAHGKGALMKLDAPIYRSLFSDHDLKRMRNFPMTISSLTPKIAVSADVFDD